MTTVVLLVVEGIQGRSMPRNNGFTELRGGMFEILAPNFLSRGGLILEALKRLETRQPILILKRNIQRVIKRDFNIIEAQERHFNLAVHVGRRHLVTKNMRKLIFNFLQGIQLRLFRLWKLNTSGGNMI
jgi:hypothetical protein